MNKKIIIIISIITFTLSSCTNFFQTAETDIIKDGVTESVSIIIPEETSINKTNNNSDDNLEPIIPNTDISSLSCYEILNLVSEEKDKVNNNCTKDSDCIFGETGGCGSCINKNTSLDIIKNIINVYEIGVKNDCLPQKDCMNFECNKCVNNKCMKN